MNFDFSEGGLRSAFMLFVCLLPLIGYGQSDVTVISGRLVKNADGIVDTPEVAVYDIDKNLSTNITTYKFSITRDSFYLTIKKPEKLYYVQFRNLFDSKNILLHNAKYLVESGSCIKMYLDDEMKSRIKTDNSLLNAQLDLLRDVDLVSNSLLYDRSNGDRHEYYFDEMRLQRNKVDVILKSYVADLTPFQYELVKKNYIGYIDAISWWQMGIMAKINEIAEDHYYAIYKRMVSVYEEYYDAPADSIVNASNTYLEAQVNYNWASGYMKARIEAIPDDWFDKMYVNIKGNYSGAIRDKLLVAALNSFNVFLLNQELIEYVEDALTLSVDEDSRVALLAFLESIMPGTKVLHFEFNTKNGDKVTLDDFKGKVVMAHFWSLGCVPCIEMAKNIHPLIEKYGNDPNIVFLSINVNPSLKHWESGLISNLYSHEKELQLNVGQVGTQHPLLKYYKYYGVPQLMLIDKNGHLVTSNAPRARNQEEYNALENTVFDLINDLKQ